ncbi:MAG: biotin carboxylase N-terminal domain-containing protein, partial [Ilumatobacteraceae bacterium]
MITRVLIANRGEIASRIIRTCRRLGVGTVAVFSDADTYAPFVREADIAWPLPGNSPADTYLRADLLIAAALARCCDAIHPGYGFLSENASFAQSVIDAGLTWIGPPPAAITAMGSKIEAKRLMRTAGVPVLPDSSVESLAEIGLPALVKASAGGGGRGMRIVERAADIASSFERCQSEAQVAFGRGDVYVEQLVRRARHIEVQVLGDGTGAVSHAWERDCTVQRNHQKLVEI